MISKTTYGLKIFSLLTLMVWFTQAAQAADSTLALVKKRGHLKCGVNPGITGFGAPDGKGGWAGMDVEFCRAVGIAVFGKGEKKVKFTPLSAQQRFVALQSREIDILSRNTTLTLSRDTKLGLNFGPVLFYDGQGFMVRKATGIKSALELSGASVCAQQGTTTELNLADYFRAQGMKLKSVVYESNEEVISSFFKKRCDVITSDSSQLAAIRARVSDPQNYIILPERISKEPLAPAVRHGDDQWLDIITYTAYTFIAAEELGLTAANVDQTLKKTKDPKISRLLGATAGNGAALGLAEDWALNIIRTLGNYDELFERNVGMGSKLKLERGLNALWTAKGERGLMYAPPFK